MLIASKVTGLSCSFSERGKHFNCLNKFVDEESGILRTIEKFRTMVYSEPEAYSELCQTCKIERFAKIINFNNCLRNLSFSRSLLYETNTMNYFNTGLIFTPEVLILCKNGWGSRETVSYILIHL